MKVVLFCGGMGMRLREYSEAIPKPLVPIGYRPILWHVMKYYAHYGHKDFILCLGWKANVFKDYFLKYDECASNNFVMAEGGHINLLGSDIHDWTITFVDTGVNANIGQRLKAVQPYLEGENTFLANYTDGLSDVHLPTLVNYSREQDSVATCLGVKPQQSFHLVASDISGTVTDVVPIRHTDMWMNGGFYVFQSSIFDYLHHGEELVEQPFQRLISKGLLSMFRYDGYFGCMDTYKEKQVLDDMYNRGERPWEVWNTPAQSSEVKPVVGSYSGNGNGKANSNGSVPSQNLLSNRA